MNYWVIVGEGGGFEEVKSIKSNSAAQTSEIVKTTVRMDDISFTTGGDGKTKIFICGEEVIKPDVFMLWGHYNEVFEGISRRLTSLGAKVIRVGTLAARESDGEFQINFLTNNFMGRLRSYGILGCFPYSMLENQVCMGPIDTSCRAFMKLSRTPKECCVFNAVNNHTLPLGDIILQMNKNGMNIELVEYEEFARALKEAQKDPDKAAILSSMTAYMNTAHGKKVVSLPFSSHYTTQILARTGFFWNASTEKYVNDFINVLKGFRFFNKDNLNR